MKLAEEVCASAHDDGWNSIDLHNSAGWAMGLLDKKNPNATKATVARQALVCAICGAAVFFLFAKSHYRESWVIALPIWLLLCAAAGAIWEWQVASD